MATNPRSAVGVSERPNLSLVPADVPADRKARKRPARSLKRRALTTVLALIVLVLMVRFLPPSGRIAEANTPASQVAAAPADLKLGEIQLARPSGSQVVYLDGMVTNGGKGVVSSATAQVDFLDGQGKLVASIYEPLEGMAQGGVGVVGNEFARHPIAPGQVRLFRVAVNDAPPQWNHEAPLLRIVAVSSPK